MDTRDRRRLIERRGPSSATVRRDPAGLAEHGRGVAIVGEEGGRTAA